MSDRVKVYFVRPVAKENAVREVYLAGQTASVTITPYYRKHMRRGDMVLVKEETLTISVDGVDHNIGDIEYALYATSKTTVEVVGIALNLIDASELVKLGLADLAGGESEVENAGN